MDGFFRPAYVNALGREYRPGRPLQKEATTRIIDLYLTGVGLTTPGAVYGIIRNYETFDTCEAFGQGGTKLSF